MRIKVPKGSFCVFHLHVTYNIQCVVFQVEKQACIITSEKMMKFYIRQNSWNRKLFSVSNTCCVNIKIYETS